jgi:membrane protein implicated in regulation of membrane protease activity
MRLAGLFEPAWQQWLAFPIVALLSLRLFRQPLLARLQGRDSGEVDSVVGDAALPASALEPGGRGKAEVRGALWNARNVSERTVGARERCRVVAINGLELDIRPE